MAITNKPVFILGQGSTRYGELWDESLESLAKNATIEALKSAEISLGKVDLLIVSNFLATCLESRAHLGALVAEEIGFDGPSFSVEAACASGGVAVRQAVAAMKSGQAKNVLVVGVEKMTDVDVSLISQALTGAASREESAVGVTFPALFALIAQAYLDEHGLESKCLNAIAAQAHNHACRNPLAQFRKKIRETEIQASILVADPIRQLHCAPITDGATALLLSLSPTMSVQPAITNSWQTSEVLSLRRRENIARLGGVERLLKLMIASEADDFSDYEVLEIHDCFSITHALILEGLGLCGIGQAPRMIGEGFGGLDSEGLVVNPSGGLKACGHPIGATGIRQIYELALQVSGRAGSRQVKNASRGLAVNLGGTGATVVGHVVERIKT